MNENILGTIQRLFSFCFKKSYYKLKLDRVKNMNLFLAGKLNETDVGTRELCKIIDIAILERRWYLQDAGQVILELSINIALTFPFLAIFIFQEIEHSAYSLRSEEINIYGFNIYNNDIWLVPKKVLFINSRFSETACLPS